MYLLITGKIFGENLSCSDIQKNNARYGNLGKIYIHIKMAAQRNINANLVMDGRSRSIIQITLRSISVDTRRIATNPIVLMPIVMMKRENNHLPGSRFSPEQGL